MASASTPSRKARSRHPRRRLPKSRKSLDPDKQCFSGKAQYDEELESIGADKDKGSLQNVLLYHRPRARAVSPYQPASEQDELRLRSLIHHYTTVVATRSVTPVGPRNEWFPFAAVDEALFHAVMSHTAAHFAYLRRVPIQNQTHYYWHIGRAIHLVNERLAAGMEKAATEGTICTVCCLAQQQAFSANVEGSRMHLNGLIQLVNAVGGINSISMNPKTRRFVLLTDLATSITLNKRFHLRSTPQLRSLDLTIYFGPATLDTETYARMFSTRLYNFTENAPLSMQAFNIYWGLRNLTIMVENIRAGRDSPDSTNASDLQFTDRVEVLERSAHVLWFEETETEIDPIPSASQEVSCTPSILSSSRNYLHFPSTSGSKSSIASPQPSINTTIPSTGTPLSLLPFHLLGHATLIHIYITLRELPPQLQMLQLVASRIHARLVTLPKLDLNTLLATFPDFMLWVMFLAGSVAGELRLRRWFAATVAKVLAVRERSRATIAAVAGERETRSGREAKQGVEWQVGMFGESERADESEVQRAATRFLWPEEVVLDPV